MKLEKGKGFLLFLMGILLTISSSISANNDYPDFNEEEIKRRVMSLSASVVQPRYTSVVRSYLRTYTVNNRDKAEKILGRSVLYFPLYEQRLREYGLPEDLKYLSVVESALNPKAKSRAGAMGLWQFMPATGKEYGLYVTTHKDDRCDPEKSTRAAAEYLLKAYNRFGDWALALAAYNSGSGRVSIAIKRARSKDFWKIQKYLPKETRNYVPAFIAATYLMNHYDKHDLYPRYPSLDMQITENVMVYTNLDFHTLAQITGTPMDILETLNPVYRKAVVPQSSYGNKVVLPKRVAHRLKNYMEAQQPDYQGSIADIKMHPVYFTSPPEMQDGNLYMQTLYVVQEGESIYDVSRIFGFSPHQIQAWNGLRSPIVAGGQQLRLYQPRGINDIPMGQPMVAAPIKYAPVVQAAPAPPPVRAIVPELEEIESRPFELLEDPFEYKISEEKEVQVKRRPVFQLYKIQKNETLLDIANKFPTVTVQDLMILNNFRSNQVPSKGSEIKVKKK